ncbi:hypothetical protein EVG20_g7428, partial [Dentipellis fragilis]
DGFEEGRMDGWQAGRQDGFEEGRKMGFREGRELGRREERKYAFKLFNKSFDSRAKFYDDHEHPAEEPPHPAKEAVGSPWVMLQEAEPSTLGVQDHEQIRQWAASTQASTRSRSRTPSPKPRPVWLHRRVTTDPAMEGRE